MAKKLANDGDPEALAELGLRESARTKTRQSNTERAQRTPSSSRYGTGRAPTGEGRSTPVKLKAAPEITTKDPASMEKDELRKYMGRIAERLQPSTRSGGERNTQASDLG